MNVKPLLALAASVGILFVLAYKFLTITTTVRKEESATESEPVTPGSMQWVVGQRVSVNPKSHVNLRECAGKRCSVLVVLERGSVVSATGRVKIIENNEGSIQPWHEVTLEEGRFCVPTEVIEQDCQAWRPARRISGWTSDTQLRSR